MATPQLYQGSCHCGTVKFEASLDFNKPISRCNCTFCHTTGFYTKMVEPLSSFKITAGKEELGDYLFGAKEAHHHLCKRCGVHPFTIGNKPQLGGDFVGVNVTCLNLDLTGKPVVHVNGKADNYAFIKADVF